MYIMADLSDKSILNKERVLCCIKIDSNGMIIMKPDFSRQSYTIHTYGSSRETYEFYLEHISSAISTENLTRELKLHKELYVRHSDYIKNLVGNMFRMVNIKSIQKLNFKLLNSSLLQKPEVGVMKVHIFGEIISAKNFDYDDLHVYYQLELPKS